MALLILGMAIVFNRVKIITYLFRTISYQCERILFQAYHDR